MMGNIKKEWDGSFVEQLQEYATSGKQLDIKFVTLRKEDNCLGDNKLYGGTKSFIDDILN